MSYKNQSQANITVALQYQGLLGIVLFSILTTVPCCVFLFINGTLLFTLRSKPVFRETSRYILLYNLLFADTVQMALSQLLYILAACRIRLTYPVCGVLVMLADLTSVISPLTLVVMCLERYVAVCYPLRHATIITIRNTGVAICLVWAFSSLNILTRVLLLLWFPFEDLESLHLKDFCGKESMLLDPMSDLYDQAYSYFLFVSAGVAVVSSYIGVMVAARSASTDKASAHKARNTLLLHLVQLGLSLSSTIHNPLLLAISKVLERIVLVRIQIVVYVCIVIFPRCLSALIYGLRDQTIRPILMYHLCCQWRCLLSLSLVPAKAKNSIVIT
ncbi:odorant receptor 131-2-like [Enoplosus armatus]|uniref:odorant receptor 131-2-like n=1 Tax=Enoplosus armatus TaxID=215367 RepID=UPI0039961BDB